MTDKIRYRNIDSALQDSTTFISIGGKVVFSNEIKAGETVTPKTDRFSMVVEIIERVDTRYRGKVFNDNSSDKIEDWSK